MSKALKEWSLVGEIGQGGGTGKTSSLARYLGVTQPAVTKMINGESPLRLKYVHKIMEFTGISAKELFPDHYELLKQSFQMEMENAIQDRKKEVVNILNGVIDDINKITT